MATPQFTGVILDTLDPQATISNTDLLLIKTPGEPTLKTTVGDLYTAIVAPEVERATQSELLISQALTDEISRATLAEETLTTNLEAEILRSTQAEGQIAQDLADEIERAKTAEGDLTTLTTTDQTSLVNAINEESARAQAVEQGLDARVTTNTNNITATRTDLYGTDGTNTGSFLKTRITVGAGITMTYDTSNPALTKINLNTKMYRLAYTTAGTAYVLQSSTDGIGWTNMTTVSI